MKKFLNIGNGSVVAKDRIISILQPDSAPLKRFVQESREKSLLIDATFGKKTRTIFIMDSGHVVLSAVSSETLISRINDATDE